MKNNFIEVVDENGDKVLVNLDNVTKIGKEQVKGKDGVRIAFNFSYATTNSAYYVLSIESYEEIKRKL